MAKGIRRWIGEMWPIAYIPRQLALAKTASALRSVFQQALIGRPVMQDTSVNYDLSRSLYRNDHVDYKLGAGFVRPMIDLCVEYIGLPQVTTKDSEFDAWLNECIHDHWAPQIQQVYRDAMRDSKTVVRFRQPRLDNPLFTEEDRMHGRIEVVPPEQCDISFDPSDPDLIERASIAHFVLMDDRTDQEILEGGAPRITEHEVIEFITPSRYQFFDKTVNKELTSWDTPNSWGFVPMWPVFNEYDVALAGGQSDIEPVLPFIQAFHDVLFQALTAHRYHSTPKAMFKLKDVSTFLVNNYPDVIDATTGTIKQGAKISFTGKEIFFFDAEEDAGFIEAKSVLGDSKTLLDFLIDCIAIASETPKWALLKAEHATDKDASVQPFEKKVTRKRIMFSEVVVMICKMAAKASGKVPTTPRVVWPTIRLADLASKGQAIQQIVLALDAAKINRWISDNTAIEILGSLFPEISSPEIEKAEAASNYEPPVPAPAAPASPTQGAQKPTNGKVPASTAKKALSTTAASNS